MSKSSLVRVRQGRIVGGVCAGLADYLDINLTLVRLVTLGIILFTGVGPFLYLLAWLAMPAQGADRSGLDSLIGQAKQWNASRNADQTPTNPPTNGENFDLYGDGR